LSFEPGETQLKKQSTELRSNLSRLLKELEDLKVDILPLPARLNVSGTPGRYEAGLDFTESRRKLEVGALVLDIDVKGKRNPPFISENDVLGRIIKRLKPAEPDSREPEYQYTIGRQTGLFSIGSMPVGKWQDRIVEGQAMAARVAAYFQQGLILSGKSSVIIEKNLCRGCGDCSALCSLIELKTTGTGLCVAEIDPAICLGCGACLAVCPTGAIKQPGQNEAAMEAEIITRLSQKSAAETNLAFVCNWDGYLNLESLNLPETFSVVKVSCLSRLHAGLLLKAFELGAAKVTLIGCVEHTCHYANDPENIERTVLKVQAIMSLLGMKKEQLELRRI
jgi:ferredoxin